MKTDNIPAYPDHAEPTEAAAEFDREEKPRVQSWSYVGGGLLLLILLMFILPLLGIKLSPDSAKQPSGPSVSPVHPKGQD